MEKLLLSFILLSHKLHLNKMEVFDKNGNKLNVPAKVEIVEMTNSVTGLNAYIYIYGNIVSIRIIGITAITLGTSEQYSRIGSSSIIKQLSSDLGSMIKRTFLTNFIFGQVVIDKATGDVKIGYTRNVEDNTTTSIPQGTAIYVYETYVL